jgi:pimeloyl-ACP methyl ester carboxylesterase
MPSTNLSGIKIAYDDDGQGSPAMLMLPGWCGPRSVFNPLRSLIAKHRRALAVDWRGHGDSGSPNSDFGANELVDDAEAVIRAANLDALIILATAHAGWVAIELRKRLGDRVKGIVSLEWFVLGAPPPFREALKGMQSPQTCRQTVDATFERWVAGVNDPALLDYVKQRMGAFGFDMWSRAAREISASFDRDPVPLHALAKLGLPVLHLYSQPRDEDYFTKQQQYSRSHPWFSVHRLGGQTHFPTFEVPQEIAREVERFASGLVG